jgi:hypothetical protein
LCQAMTESAGSISAGDFLVIVGGRTPASFMS